MNITRAQLRTITRAGRSREISWGLQGCDRAHRGSGAGRCHRLMLRSSCERGRGDAALLALA
jgi:hypothetical protein